MINAPQNCCDGMTQVCKLDSTGIPRCFGGAAGPCPKGYTGVSPCCIAVGSTCQFKDQCCGSTPCVPDSLGVLRCSVVACQPSGGVCTSGADCCAGLGCVNFLCAAAARSFAGQACSPTAGCCTGLNCQESNFLPCMTATGCTCGVP
jgi:hypothetical protein